MTTDHDPGRRERKRLLMLEQIRHTAATLFGEHGYEAVTMEQIADRADIAKRTLYKHFPSKEAVLAFHVDAQLKQDLAYLHHEVAQCPTFQAQALCILRASADWCAQHPEFLKAYLRHQLLNTGAASKDSDITQTWQTLIVLAQGSGELKPSLNPEQLAHWFHHLYFGAMLRWLNQPELSLHQEFEAMTQLFLQGAALKGTA